jgi:oligoribonuclease NrnB/cAMP/cGMP phosphodiesterase (DHH superfamily)
MTLTNTPRVTKIDVCIYHSGCSDGFGAAWAVYKKFGAENVEYLPGTHANKAGEEEYWLEKVRGKHVVCYDFSFSYKLTEKLQAEAATFKVIDHHLSAQKELGGLDYCYFNMDKSGAVLAWESVFYQGQDDYWVFKNTSARKVPKLLEYVQDRDLWRWRLDKSKQIWNFISACDHSFEAWDVLHESLESASKRERMAEHGEAMKIKVSHISKEIAADFEMWDILGHKVAVANCPRTLRSDVCEELGKSGAYPFVGCYQVEEGTATWSLRSNHGTEDVSVIAARYPDGGGHKQAAGFTIPVDKMDFKHRKIL